MVPTTGSANVGDAGVGTGHVVALFGGQQHQTGDKMKI